MVTTSWLYDAFCNPLYWARTSSRYAHYLMLPIFDDNRHVLTQGEGHHSQRATLGKDSLDHSSRSI